MSPPTRRRLVGEHHHGGEAGGYPGARGGYQWRAGHGDLFGVER